MDPLPFAGQYVCAIRDPNDDTRPLLDPPGTGNPVPDYTLESGPAVGTGQSALLSTQAGYELIFADIPCVIARKCVFTFDLMGLPSCQPDPKDENAKIHMQRFYGLGWMPCGCFDCPPGDDGGQPPEGEGDDYGQSILSGGGQ